MFSVDFGISGLQMTCILDSIALFRGYPAAIRTDQDHELTCWMLAQWIFEHGVELRFFNWASRHRTDLLRALTGAFVINV